MVVACCGAVALQLLSVLRRCAVRMAAGPSDFDAQGIIGLLPTLMHPLPSHLQCPTRSKSDCRTATKADLSSAKCLCNNTAPYLHCHALATKEAAAKLQEALADADVFFDGSKSGLGGVLLWQAA